MNLSSASVNHSLKRESRNQCILVREKSRGRAIAVCGQGSEICAWKRNALFIARAEARYVDCSLSPPPPLHIGRRGTAPALDNAFCHNQDADRYFSRH